MSTIEELLSKYIQNTERVFAEMKLSRDIMYVDMGSVNRVVGTAKRYLEDAKYYRDRKRFETGLVSIAYGEGLLDALRLLNMAVFQWPTEKRGRL